MGRSPVRKVKMNEYKILFDYGSFEGMKFYNEKTFKSVDEAVKFAVRLGYGTPFLIVQIMWNPNDFHCGRREMNKEKIINKVNFAFAMDCYDCGCRFRFINEENIIGNMCYCIKCGSKNFDCFENKENPYLSKEQIEKIEKAEATWGEHVDVREDRTTEDEILKYAKKTWDHLVKVSKDETIKSLREEISLGYKEHIALQEKYNKLEQENKELEKAVDELYEMTTSNLIAREETK